MSSSAVAIEGLGKKYASPGMSGEGRWALKDVTLEIRRGETFGIIGQNGAGKTTLLKILSGLLRQTCGTVLIDGQKPDRAESRAKFGFLPESPNFHMDLTVRETLVFQAGLYRLGAEDVRARIPEAVDAMGLGPHLHMRVDNCSKGTKQRLALAALLVPAPEIIVLDEPFSGLDPSVRHRLDIMLEQFGDRNNTTLLCAHELPEIARHCSRVGILHNGRLALVLNRDEFGGSAEKLEKYFLETVGDAR